MLAFVAIGNAIEGGVRALDSSSGELHSLRLAVNLSASVLLSAWALARVRAQWAEDAGRAAAEPPARAEADVGAKNSSPAPRRRWLKYARWALIAGLTAVAAVTISSQWGTLQAAAEQLSDLHWRMLRWAIYAEALAMVAFAQLTRLLLRAGGVRLRLGPMIGLTLASNAVQLTLPGGPAWAISFSFDQLRRRGVRASLTAYALAVTWLLSAAALLTIALLGVDLAGDTGPAAPFRLLATAATVGLAVAGAAAVVLARRPRLRTRAGRGLEKLCGVPRLERLATLVQASVRDLRQVRLPPHLLLRCCAAAALNWIYDCGCLVFSILAVGGHVPWQGVLAAYGLTQLAAALPITPGGVGVVEATLSLLLIAYHTPATTAVAAVLLYRILSFWTLVPIGWGAVVTLLAMRRHGRGTATWIPRPAKPMRQPQASTQ